MKVNYLLAKGYRYFVRLSGNGVPVLSSMIARKKAPRRGSNGVWADVTSCLEGCCAQGIDVVTNPLALAYTTAGVKTGNILTAAGVTSTNGETLSVTPISQTSSGLIITVSNTGAYSITVPSPSAVSVSLIVQVTDTSGNVVYITVNITTTVA